MFGNLLMSELLHTLGIPNVLTKMKWSPPHTQSKGIYFVNTELHFSPGWLLFSSPTDFMIYSILQGLTKHLAGALLPIYCMEHLRETQQQQQQTPSTAFSSWRGRRAGADIISSLRHPQQQQISIPKFWYSSSLDWIPSSASLLC